MIANGVRSIRARAVSREKHYWVACAALAATLVFGFAPMRAAAQAPPGPQPPAPEQPPPKPPADAPKSAAPPADATPAYNPVPAEKDVEVATFYMRKGDSDAAIPRLEDAIRAKPDYAKPRMMLAEIYEKKGDKQDAVKYYREYLQVYPHAPDAKKVQDKIDKLSKN
jgi:tetratricopeptide (TPR) repeat protein